MRDTVLSPCLTDEETRWGNVEQLAQFNKTSECRTRLQLCLLDLEAYGFSLKAVCSSYLYCFQLTECPSNHSSHLFSTHPWHLSQHYEESYFCNGKSMGLCIRSELLLILCLTLEKIPYLLWFNFLTCKKVKDNLPP